MLRRIFGGETFSTADIMMHFIAELGPDPNYFSIDLAKYPHFQAWQKRVTRAHRAADSVCRFRGF